MNLLPELVQRASAPYRSAGRGAWHFARGKLGHDPVFAAMLQSGLFDRAHHILDLGCGQGLLANWLHAAHTLQHEGRWPSAWPAVGRFGSYRGLDIATRSVARGRAAMPEGARLELADIREAGFDTADRIVILDVLHYMPVAEQETVLDKVVAALAPGGLLLMRVGDPGAGWRFRFTAWTDRLIVLSHGHGWAPLHPRPLDAWRAALETRGLRLQSQPMSAGTPFANVLLLAQKPGPEGGSGPSFC
jgi:SAM-dependent methyltransferase